MAGSISMAGAFERAGNLQALCEQAATAFRTLTGFDRVMVYRFLDDESGRVIAEERDPALHSFLHHHFPATDIPKQARALYIRNRTRAIPHAVYAPAVLRPAGFEALDLSDVALRSVSPIHLRYLTNMGVAASASISIVKDGLLWGMIACHNMTPRGMAPDVRATASTLASSLARQIRAKEEAEGYRERLRLRSAEDAVVLKMTSDGRTAQTVAAVRDDLCRMLGGDGSRVCPGPARRSRRGTARVMRTCSISSSGSAAAVRATPSPRISCRRCTPRRTLSCDGERRAGDAADRRGRDAAVVPRRARDQDRMGGQSAQGGLA
ncbi:GAF domain-containing protein [Sphingomonas sp. 22R3R2A-7]|uniref:GAF domain-containing protein n=1 Tax=Sphingomonas sp. 22R3R2A-7 TaxID=3050230 RepID=UPI002FDF344E